MAPPISQNERTWLYITWPATFVVHVLQIRCMPAQPRSLQCSIFLFAILTLSFFGGFAACDTVDEAGQASDAAFGLFTTLEIVCMIHVIFLQYVSTIYPLAATLPSSKARLGFRVNGPVTVVRGTPLQSGRRKVIFLGILAQCILVLIGGPLLALHDTEFVFGTPNISYVLTLCLLVYSLIHERRSRTSNFWWWTGLTATMLAASVTLLGIGLHYAAVPVFGIQCIFALIDSLGGVFRYYQVSRGKEPEAKTPPPRAVGRPRRDTPSFGDFCTSRSDVSSLTSSPSKSSDTAVPSLVHLPAHPPPAATTLPLRDQLLPDHLYAEKATPPPRLLHPLSPAIPTDPRMFSDIPPF